MKSFERHFVFFDLGWGGKGFKAHSDKTQLDIGFWEMGFAKVSSFTEIGGKRERHRERYKEIEMRERSCGCVVHVLASRSYVVDLLVCSSLSSVGWVGIGGKWR